MSMKIIVVDGLDKSGKHTVACELEQYLANKGLNVVRSEFGRYDTASGRMILDYLHGKEDMDSFTHQTLLYVNKQEQQRWFRELDEQGVDYLLLDRYTYAQFTYGLYAIVNDLIEDNITPLQAEQQIITLEAMSNGALLLPDANIIFDVPADVSMSRKGQHGDNDRYESDFNMLNTVRQMYLDLAVSRDDSYLLSSDQPLEKLVEGAKELIDIVLSDLEVNEEMKERNELVPSYTDFDAFNFKMNNLNGLTVKDFINLKRVLTEGELEKLKPEIGKSQPINKKPYEQYFHVSLWEATHGF